MICLCEEDVMDLSPVESQKYFSKTVPSYSRKVYFKNLVAPITFRTYL